MMFGIILKQQHTHLHLRARSLGLQEDSNKLRRQIVSLEQELQAAKIEFEALEVRQFSRTHVATHSLQRAVFMWLN